MSHQPHTVVAVVVDSRTLVLSAETRSAMSKTQRRVLARLLVNPVEGTQRLLQCASMSTAQVTTVLCTQADAATMAGLPGMYFAMSDVGAGTVVVRGSKGTKQLVDAWKEFVRRKYPELDAKDVESDEGKKARFERRQGFDVVAVTLKPVSGGLSENTGGFCIWCAVEEARKRKDDESSSSEEGDEDGEVESNGGSSSGAEENESEDGQADDDSNEKEQPPLCNSLFKSPTMCYLIRPDNGPIVGVVDSKDHEDVQSLISNPHMMFRCSEHRPKVLFHLSSTREVSQTEPYKEWVSRTGVAKHVYLAECFPDGNHVLTRFDASSKLVSTLHYTGPEFFPALDRVMTINNNQDPAPVRSFICHDASDGFMDVVESTSKDETEHKEEVVMDGDQGGIEVDPNEIQVEEDESPALKQLKLSEDSDSNERTFPRLVFLGTGAAKPSTLRGLSCCQLWLSATRSILLDAGEDTINQMKRVETMRGWTAYSSIDSLEMIWISHHHLDHHGGLYGLLEVFLQRRKLVETNGGAPLIVCAPASVRSCLSRLFPKERIQVVACEEISLVLKRLASEDPHETQLQGLFSTRVDHCFDSHAIAIDLCYRNTPLRVLYTGDTRPCTNRLLKMGQRGSEGTEDVTPSATQQRLLVVIHEATFEDDLFEEAKKKRHSTVKEAIQVGKHLKVRMLLLTHFSQRYPKRISLDPETEENKLKNPMLVMQAHDLFQVDLGRFVENPSLYAKKALDMNRSMMMHMRRGDQGAETSNPDFSQSV